MKKIGFVDYYISEWHANNYPAWIKEICDNHGYDYEISYAWAELFTSPKFNNETTDMWCERMGVEKCETIDELCKMSDVILVLAPSDPDKHLGYAKEVLKHKKPTYIDKTFAPDFATAKEIFDIAEKYGTPFFSTSALRYGTELDEIGPCTQMMTTGSGSNYPEYIIHQIEMIVKKLGKGAKRIRYEEIGKQAMFRIGYDDERAASMTYASGKLPFSAFMTDGENKLWKKIESDYFKILMHEIIKFYETGKLPFDPEETLEVAKIREFALKASNTPDEWIEIQ